MSSQYKIIADLPSTSSSLSSPSSTTTAARLVSFMESFYETSDDPVAHERYARDYFTADATLIMGSKRAEGYDEILAFRKGLWTAVASRRHTPTKIFFGGHNDLMLFGKVAYVIKANQKGVEIDWAGRVEFGFDEAGDPKMKFYQVYLDTAAQLAAAQAAN